MTLWILNFEDDIVGEVTPDGNLIKEFVKAPSKFTKEFVKAGGKSVNGFPIIHKLVQNRWV